MKKTIAKIILLAVILPFGIWHTGLIQLQPAQAAPGDLTATISRTFPTNNIVGMTFELLNDGVVVFSKTYTERFDPAIGLVMAQENRIIARAQKDVNIYKAQWAVFMSPAYMGAEARIVNSLNLD